MNNTTAADILLAIAIGLAIVGAVGTIYGMLQPWLARRREQRERLRERDRVNKRNREGTK